MTGGSGRQMLVPTLPPPSFVQKGPSRGQVGRSCWEEGAGKAHRWARGLEGTLCRKGVASLCFCDVSGQ